MSIWHWQRWIPATDLLDEWVWMPGELIGEVKAGRLTPMDRFTLEPITFHDNATPKDIAEAVLDACFNAEAVQEYQQENNVHTKSGAEAGARFTQSIIESARRLFDSQETASRPSALIFHKEPDSPATLAERLRSRAVPPQEIIEALGRKWPHLRKYELGAYAKGLDPKDVATRKAAEGHYSKHKPGAGPTTQAAQEKI